MKQTKLLPPANGFTFVEVIIASFLGAVVLIGAALMWYYFVDNFQFVSETSQGLSIARTNIHQMTRELREARTGVAGAYPLVTAQDQEIVFYSNIDDDSETERIRYYLVDNQLIKQVFNIVPGTDSYTCSDGCTICHDGNTLNVDEHAWPAHSNHGDLLGPCGTGGGEEGEGTTGGDVYEKVVADYVSNEGEPIFTYYNGDWPGDIVNNPLTQSERLLHTRYIKANLSIQLSDGPAGANEVTVENAVHLRSLKDNL